MQLCVLIKSAYFDQEIDDEMVDKTINKENQMREFFAEIV